MFMSTRQNNILTIWQKARRTRKGKVARMCLSVGSDSPNARTAMFMQNGHVIVRTAMFMSESRQNVHAELTPPGCARRLPWPHRLGFARKPDVSAVSVSAVSGSESESESLQASARLPLPLPYQ